MEGPINVVFAGTQFVAGLPMTRAVLEKRGILSGVQLSQVAGPELPSAMQSAHVVLPFMERLDASMLETAPNLRIVIQYGVGVEGVDAAAASRLGIAVSNMPAAGTGNAEATAELALYLCMALLRHQGDLPRRFAGRELGGLPIPRQLRGKRVTVCGFGNIGRTLCRALAVFGAEVRAVRRSPWPADLADSEPEAALLTDFTSSLEDFRTRFAPLTDVLVLACPLTDATRGLVDDKLLSTLPRGALVVNVGRGQLATHSAVLDALNDGRLGGFASDVGIGHPSKPAEPWDPDDELSHHPLAIFTPHVGGYCDGAYDKMAQAAVDAVERARDGHPPDVWLNRSGNSARL